MKLTLFTMLTKWTEFRDWSADNLAAIILIGLGFFVLFGLIVSGKKGLDKHYRKTNRTYPKR